ncbi:YodC family protein [Minwuia sp.]|uniref:YodC family protein n=1 Tax=Minwuia sp. TaxID=2493630 RepID=UPI003A9222E9
MSSDIKPGDVVRLKSGGPDMTVTLIDKANDWDKHQSAWCEWFDEKDKKPMNRVYAVHALEQA